MPVHQQPGAASEIVKRKFPTLRTLPDAEDLAVAVKEHIDNASKINKGAFVLYDDIERRDLRLKLTEVYKRSARYIKKDRYFIRVAFKDEDGSDYYDVDFWITRWPFGNLVVYDQRIQKKNGFPRYFYEGDKIVEIK